MGVDEMGVDKMGVDEMGVDEMGTHQSCDISTHVTEYCTVFAPMLYGATNCCKRSYQPPSLSCGMG